MSRKRAASNLPPRSNMDDKHASLMQDYRLLQDEYVSLKDQLQTAKTRKTSLLAEVRFLRQRLKMLKYSSIDSKKLLDTTEVPMFWEPHKVIGSDETVKWEGVNDNIGLVSAPRVAVFRNGPNVFATTKAGKRKISWEDQISLECN